MNVIEVEVVKAVPAGVEPAFVRRILTRASKVPEMAARMPAGRSTVAVRITSAEELRALNKAYAREDHTTDVLSFTGEGDHLGDIAVSWPAVVEQGRRQGHGENVELAILLVHGFLHLLGWDHRTRAETTEMWRLTDLPLSGRLAGYTRERGLRRSPRA
ncbi:MAG TPA: rRNA maturation RNase YbeY [Candidatus Dormibacteraeota bacterium]|nr:rRNA maturation RNase YbeY [Candidatus Dormibacteraeota bacterium]